MKKATQLRKQFTRQVYKGNGIYISNSSAVSDITANYVCGATDHGIYLNKNACVTTIEKNTVDVIGKEANGIYLIGDSSVQYIKSTF